MLLTIPNTFQNGTGAGNIIDATQMNSNFSAVVTVLNGNLEKNNVKTGSSICLDDTVMTISAAWVFSTNPVFNAGAIADNYLTSNIPKKDAANVFAAQQEFAAGINLDRQQAQNFVCEKVASLPGGTSQDIGRIVYCTGDNKFYGWNGTAWQQIDYTGGYTGGAVRGYSATLDLDNGNSSKLWFKTEGASPTVKIALMGLMFPKRFYTELGYHNHGITDGGHAHNAAGAHNHHVDLGSHTHSGTFGSSSHTHNVSGTTGSESSHTHGGGTYSTGTSATHVHHSVQIGSDETGASGAHSHTNFVGSSGAGSAHSHTFSDTSDGPSATASVSSTDLGGVYSAYTNPGPTDSAITGITINAAGINAGTLSASQKQYADSLTVSIDGTDVTAAILSATGWSQIGDGTATHDFHVSGTGEMNASAWKSYAAGFHVIEITEPTTDRGCRIMIHIETF